MRRRIGKAGGWKTRKRLLKRQIGEERRKQKERGRRHCQGKAKRNTKREKGSGGMRFFLCVFPSNYLMLHTIFHKMVYAMQGLTLILKHV